MCITKCRSAIASVELRIMGLAPPLEELYSGLVTHLRDKLEELTLATLSVRISIAGSEHFL